MTFIGFIALFSYFAARLKMIYKDNEHSFNQMEVSFTEAELHDMNITLGKFNNSLNFVTGISYLPEGFDILNNPYVSFRALERTGGRVFYDKYELEICSDDHLRHFLPEHALGWYN